MTAMAHYHAHGVRFDYPQGWDLTEEVNDRDVTITVSDAGPFWSLTILRSCPPAEHVLAEALGAFQEEYEDVDVYSSTAVIDGRPAASKQLEFVALELINCVFLSAAEVGGRTLFVMAQVTDHERSEYEATFQQLGESLRCDPEKEVEDEL